MRGVPWASFHRAASCISRSGLRDDTSDAKWRSRLRSRQLLYQTGLADDSQALSSGHQPSGNSHENIHRGTPNFASLCLELLSNRSASPGSVFVYIAFNACLCTLLQSENSESEKIHLDAVQSHTPEIPPSLRQCKMV
jgi:hypothetical protein